MANSSFDFLPKSTESLSINRDVKPEPVPPPKEWKTKNPCRPQHWSAWNTEQKTVKIQQQQLHSRNKNIQTKGITLWTQIQHLWLSNGSICLSSLSYLIFDNSMNPKQLYSMTSSCCYWSQSLEFLKNGSFILWLASVISGCLWANVILNMSSDRAVAEIWNLSQNLLLLETSCRHVLHCVTYRIS